jgi:hypothetical protein
MGNLNSALRTALHAACALGLAALPVAATAAEAAGTIAGCRTLRDDSARLACYDRLPDPAAARVAVAPAMAASGAAAAPAAAPARAQAPAPAAATATAAPAPTPTPLTAEQRFGKSELQQARAEQAKAPPKEELKELRARATSVQRIGQGGLRITLANGQQWYQISPSEKIEVAVGDEIVIKPASFGSYLLVDHDRHSARVHRAE